MDTDTQIIYIKLIVDHKIFTICVHQISSKTCYKQEQDTLGESKMLDSK